MESISIKFPFGETTEGGIFDVNKTTQEAIRSNLISLLTMRKGQRLMHNDFYSPLYDYIMEPWDEISEEELRDKLIEKIGKYIPEISVEDIAFTFNEDLHLLETKIKYFILELGEISDEISISMPIEQ